jgi:tetratricopeptide (TPR) repeat protein
MGELANSYKLIQGISSPNTENIRGNLYLLRKKYELAYAQFKLALEMKQNSQNALERLLPLAWIMKDWQKGVEYAEWVIASPQTQIGKLTVIAAFLLQSERYDDAKNLLNIIAQRSRNGYHLDAAQIHAFVGIVQNNREVVRRHARASCDQYDLMYCWVGLQMETWEAFPLTMKRKDKIIEKQEWEKLTQEDIDQPLKEVSYVNQLDIEELDDQLIKLTPQATP